MVVCLFMTSLSLMNDIALTMEVASIVRLHRLPSLLFSDGFYINTKSGRKGVRKNESSGQNPRA